MLEETFSVPETTFRILTKIWTFTSAEMYTLNFNASETFISFLIDFFFLNLMPEKV